MSCDNKCEGCTCKPQEPKVSKRDLWEKKVQLAVMALTRKRMSKDKLAEWINDTFERALQNSLVSLGLDYRFGGFTINANLPLGKLMHARLEAAVTNWLEQHPLELPVLTAQEVKKLHVTSRKAYVEKLQNLAREVAEAKAQQDVEGMVDQALAQYLSDPPVSEE